MNNLHHAPENSNLVYIQNVYCAGAGVNAKDKLGNTVLHRSTLFDRLNDLKAFLASGADVNSKDKNGETRLHGADNIEAKILIYAGADVNSKDNDGVTPLHYAGSEITKILIAAGADVNIKDNKGRTPLHYARNKEAKLLIAAGADVNSKDNKRRTPLHYAFNKEARKLIFAGEKTALYASVYFRRVDLLKTLFAAGADVNVKDNRGDTFLDLAVNCPDIKGFIKYAVLHTNMQNKPKFEQDMLCEYWNICEEQVNKLKETSIKNISLFKFLTETDENKLALYSEYYISCKLERAVLVKMFPLYADDIEAQFVKGDVKVCLLHKSRELMKKYICEILPIEIIRKICEYLSNDDLENFVLI